MKKLSFILLLVILYAFIMIFFIMPRADSVTKITVTKDTSGNVDGITKLRTANKTVCIDLTGNTRAGTFDTLTGTHTGNVVGNVTGNVVGNVTGDVVGNLTGNVTGGIVVADTIDTSSFVALWESVTGTLLPKTDAGITYNAGTGMLTVTGVTAPVTGELTGAATVTDAAGCKVNSNRVMEGSAVATPNVLRNSFLTIQDGTTGVSVACTLTTLFNGDAITVQDDIAKGETKSNFELAGDGLDITIHYEGLSGKVLGIIGVNIYSAYAAALDIIPAVVTDDIFISVHTPGSYTTPLDITTLVGTGLIVIQITYITDA